MYYYICTCSSHMANLMLTQNTFDSFQIHNTLRYSLDIRTTIYFLMLAEELFTNILFIVFLVQTAT